MTLESNVLLAAMELVGKCSFWLKLVLLCCGRICFEPESRVYKIWKLCRQQTPYTEVVESFLLKRLSSPEFFHINVLYSSGDNVISFWSSPAPGRGKVVGLEDVYSNLVVPEFGSLD